MIMVCSVLAGNSAKTSDLSLLKIYGLTNSFNAPLGHVLILDDWGLIVPDPEKRQDVLELLDDRYKKRATIVTSQLPIARWHEYLQDPTFGDAIMDRLLHNAIRLDLGGPTMRKKYNTVQTGEFDK